MNVHSVSESTRQNILDAAFRIFGEYGYRATTIKQIAEAAGLAAGTIYTHFSDKEELFRTTVEEGWRDFLEQFRVVESQQAQPLARIKRVIDLGFQQLKRSLPLMRGMLFEASQLRLFQQHLDTVVDSLVELFCAAGAQGALPISGVRSEVRFMVRTLTVGALFSASLAAPEATDREIEALRSGLLQFLTLGDADTEAGG